MLFKELSRLLGLYFIGFVLLLIIPTAVAFYYESNSTITDHPQPHTTLAFLMTMATSLFIGTLLLFLGRGATKQLFRREGITAVVLIWFLTPLIGSLPFIYSGTLQNPHQAYFELASGFTTTGATVLQAKKYNEKGEEIKIEKTVPGVINTTYSYYGTVEPIRDADGKIIVEGIEAVSKALLFWRSFTQWLGGVGVVVLFVAILPALGIGGKVLFQSEIPGPVKEGVTPRIKETAIQLWKVYLVLTALQIVILMMAEPLLTWLDSFTITFSTLSTGGFSIKNQSLASYQSPTVEWIVLLFMLFGSLNFTLYYYSFKGKFYRLNDPELILHALFVLFFAGFISFSIIGAPKTNLLGETVGTYSSSDALRYGIFQSVSAQTSTGFSTIDYDLWPYLPQVLLLIAMYVGGMSGSTAGGIKTVRFYMLFKIAQYKIESLFSPETIRSFRIGGKSVDLQASTMSLVFFTTIIALSTISVLLYLMDGIDAETSMGLVACMVNNTGLAFRAAGPLESCAFLSDFGLGLSSFLMILGRLEFFAVLALLIPAFWRQE